MGLIMVSVVIPVYNERESKMRNLAQKADSYLEHNELCELIISDDGSSKDCIGFLLQYMTYKGDRLKIVRNVHTGKWGAIRGGFLQASGEKVFLLDADLSVGFGYVLDHMFTRSNLLGNRYMHKDTKYPFKRVFFSKAFMVLRRIMTGVKYEDSQCPMKCIIKTQYSIQVFKKMRETGFIGDVEFLMLMRGVKFKEIPVRYIYIESGFNVWKNSWKMFLGLVRLMKRRFK